MKERPAAPAVGAGVPEPVPRQGLPPSPAAAPPPKPLLFTDEIVPLSRVQTVDSTQGALMRLFDLRTVTVKTASGAGTVAIACLDDTVAQQVVARLVTVTAATPEDAT